MATEKIERLISKEAIGSFQDLKELVDANVAGFEKLVAAGVELNTSLGKAKTFKDFNEEITKLKANESALTTQVNQLTVALEALQKQKKQSGGVSGDLEKAEKRLSDSYGVAGRKLAEVREQQLLVNAANKKSAQETLGLVDAYKQLENEFKKASREAQNLTIQYGANSAEAKEAIALAQSLDTRLKEADYSIGKYGRNVGNYGNALKTLEAYLADVRTELTATKQAAGTGLSISIPTGPASGGARNPTGPIRANDQATQQMVRYSKATGEASERVQDLQKKEELLSRIVQSQIAGYASATQELKSNEKALQALGAAGLENTAFYKALLADTAKLKDSVGDLKAEIKALASDTRQFDLVAGAVTGLVNAFQIGASAAELFTDNNEEIQKSIQRLIALQNIAQGIQQIANDLTEKGTALNKLYNFIIGEGATTKQAATVSTTVNTVATEANAAAQEAAAVATTGLATATKVLRGALVASGIGLLIAGIIYLITKLQEWRDADIELIKHQAELNAATLETIRINKDLVSLTKTDVGTSVQAVKNKLAANQAYGKSQGEILANELDLLNIRNKLANQKFFDTGGFGKLDKLQTQLNDAANAYEDFITTQAKASKGDKIPEKDFNAKKELLQSNLELAKESFAEQKEITEEFVTFNNDISNKQLQIDRLNADEKRKFALASATLSADAIIEANQRGLANDRATYEQRVALINSTIEQGKNKAKAVNQNVQKDPGASKTDKSIAAKQLQADINKIDKDGAEAQRKLKEDYRKRDVEAEFASAKTVIDTRMKAAEEIRNNENKSLEDRLFAAYDFMQAEEALIKGEMNLQLETAGLTATERKAIEDDANAKILQSRIAFSKSVNEITLQELQKQGDNRLAVADKQNSEAIIKLNEQLDKGLISLQQYNKERLKIETTYGALSIAIQIENIQKVIDEYKVQNKDVTKLEADLADKQKEISDNLTNAKIENLEKLREKQLEVSQELTDLFVALDDASIEKEQEKIDKEIEAVEDRKQRDIDYVNQTIQDEQLKQDALIVINAKAQRDKEMLAERQKKLDADKARTDKLVAAGRILGDTASAVFKLTADAAAAKAQAALLLANPVTAAYAPIAAASAVSIAAQIPFVIGSGAIQLAKVLGTKAFRFGGVTETDGTVLVGDGFQSEFGVTKEGTVVKTPPVPTLMNFPADTTIYPNQKTLEASIMNDYHSGPVLTDTGTHFRYMTEKIGSKIDTLTRTIKRKKETHVIVKKDAFEMMTRSAGNDTEYLNKSLK